MRSAYPPKCSHCRCGGAGEADVSLRIADARTIRESKL